MMSSSVKNNSDSFPSNINVYYNELPELHVELLSSIAVSTMIGKYVLLSTSLSEWTERINPSVGNDWLKNLSN